MFSPLPLVFANKTTDKSRYPWSYVDWSKQNIEKEGSHTPQRDLIGFLGKHAAPRVVARTFN